MENGDDEGCEDDVCGLGFLTNMCLGDLSFLGVQYSMSCLGLWRSGISFCALDFDIVVYTFCSRLTLCRFQFHFANYVLSAVSRDRHCVIAISALLTMPS